MLVCVASNDLLACDLDRPEVGRFLEVAGPAKKLKVVWMSTASPAAEWEDVIEAEIIVRAARYAPASVTLIDKVLNPRGYCAARFVLFNRETRQLTQVL